MRSKGQIDPARVTESSRLSPGQRIWYGEFPGTVSRLYSDGETEGARMYEVRLPGGLGCVAGSDLTPREGA